LNNYATIDCIGGNASPKLELDEKAAKGLIGKAGEEFEKFRVVQDMEFESDFDREV